MSLERTPESTVYAREPALGKHTFLSASCDPGPQVGLTLREVYGTNRAESSHSALVWYSFFCSEQLRGVPQHSSKHSQDSHMLDSDEKDKKHKGSNFQ